jgi:hypothetical protein
MDFAVGSDCVLEVVEDDNDGRLGTNGKLRV